MQTLPINGGARMKKLEVGQVLYSGRTDYFDKVIVDGISEKTVTKIGRKYFYCDNQERYPYDIETLLWKDKVYNSRKQLYLTREEIEERREKERLLSNIEKFFRDYTNPKKLDVMQLTKIWDIIDEVQE